MTDEARETLAGDLAERFGNTAWEGICEQGIFLPGYDCFGTAGQVCKTHNVVRRRVRPKPLARSLDALVPLVEAWCDEQSPPSDWIVHRTHHGAHAYAAVIMPQFPDDAKATDVLPTSTGDGEADTPAEALALAVRAAMQAEEGGNADAGQ